MLTSGRRNFLVRGGAALIVIIAAAGIVSTHRVFSHTYDEAYHLAAGIEWLQRGKYELDIFHPPLARAAAAVAPFVDGARVQQHADLFTTAHSTLYARPGKYLRTLALARIGILPFFLLAGALDASAFCSTERRARDSR